jgi:hypothetical protein
MRPGRACSEAASNGAHARPVRSHLQQARGAKSLYWVRRQYWFRFPLENPACYGKPYSDVHQAERLHNSPYSTTTAGVR